MDIGGIVLAPSSSSDPGLRWVKDTIFFTVCTTQIAAGMQTTYVEYRVSHVTR